MSENEAPAYAVIFTSVRTEGDDTGYAEMAERMMTLAQSQPGFCAVESAREENGAGITVSYWRDMESIRNWKQNAQHLVAQQLGREKWYQSFRLEICEIVRAYDFERAPPNSASHD